MSAVERYFDMWNFRDTSAVAEILEPDWVDHAHPEVSAGDVAAAVRNAPPGLRFEIDAVLCGGEGLVAAVGGVVGGVVGGTRLVWLFRRRGERLAELWTYRSV
jgi:hypothetical protein